MNDTLVRTPQFPNDATIVEKKAWLQTWLQNDRMIGDRKVYMPEMSKILNVTKSKLLKYIIEIRQDLGMAIDASMRQEIALDWVDDTKVKYQERYDTLTQREKLSEAVLANYLNAVRLANHSDPDKRVPIAETHIDRSMINAAVSINKDTSSELRKLLETSGNIIQKFAATTELEQTASLNVNAQTTNVPINITLENVIDETKSAIDNKLANAKVISEGND